MAPVGSRAKREEAGERVLDFQPLYLQVKELIIRRIVSGVWRPGGAVPSEMRLAAELGVSQGTVRKAIEELAAQNLVTRQQGRGTFVASHSHQRAQFHFMRIIPEDGQKELPTGRLLALAKERADSAQAEHLRLRAGAPVYALLRLRSIGGKPVMLERIFLPAALFPDLSLPLHVELPDELYGHYERNFGMTVVRAEDRLRAVAADALAATHLGVAPGAPLLEVERTALGLDGTVIEWRFSHCNTQHHHYGSGIE